MASPRCSRNRALCGWNDKEYQEDRVVKYFAILWIICPCFAACYADQPPPPLSVKIVAFNDFHGSLLSPGKFAPAVGQPAVVAGGADYLAAYIAERLSHNPNHVIVSAGDLVGASPLISAAYHDEGTIEVMNLLGLELTAVGNHEFDAGSAELLRKQNGGCFKDAKHSCLEHGAFPGAKFKYLAANVMVNATGKPLLPAYDIKTFSGIRIAFIGLVLNTTPTIVLPSGVAGLTFADEASAVNQLLPALREQRVNSVVVLIHQGASPEAPLPEGTTINDCATISTARGAAAIKKIVAQLPDDIDLVISAHTHVAYNCLMANRTGRAIPVTQASAFGRVITDIDMQFDPATQRISAISANNVLISQPDADLPTSPVHSYLSSTQVSAIRGLIADYATAVAPIANQVIGSISQALPSGPMASGSGEELAGDLVADSQLAATATAAKGGAVISFINGSGIRNPGFNLPNVTYPHDVTYQEAFSVRPFGDSLVSMTLTAQQLKDALEQQFAGCNGQTENNILEVSKGLHVDWSSTSAPCNRIVNVILRSSDGAAPDQIVLNHTVRHPSRRYRISVDNFLAAGKSGFSTFLKGRDQTGGPQDIDALVAFMKANYHSANKPFDPTDPSLGIPRITKVD